MYRKLLLEGKKIYRKMDLTVPSEKGAANCVPEASVIRGLQALSGFIGRKGSCRLFDKVSFKARRLTVSWGYDCHD